MIYHTNEYSDSFQPAESNVYYQRKYQVQKTTLFSKIVTDVGKNLRLQKNSYVSLASTVGRYVTVIVKTP